MITQYAKIYLDSGGNVTHCVTQLLPFADGLEPIEATNASECIDVEIDTDFDDVGFDQPIMTADEILQSVEVMAGNPTAKANTKVMGNPRKQPVNESSVKERIAQEIADTGIDVDGLIEKFKKAGRQITKLTDLNPRELIRARKQLMKSRGQDNGR